MGGGSRERNRRLHTRQRHLPVLRHAIALGLHHDACASRVRFGEQRLQPFGLVGQQGDLERVVRAPERKNRERFAIRRQPNRADLTLLTRQSQRLQRAAELRLVRNLVQAEEIVVNLRASDGAERLDGATGRGSPRFGRRAPVAAGSSARRRRPAGGSPARAGTVPRARAQARCPASQSATVAAPPPAARRASSAEPSPLRCPRAQMGNTYRSVRPRSILFMVAVVCVRAPACTLQRQAGWQGRSRRRR